MQHHWAKGFTKVEVAVVLVVVIVAIIFLAPALSGRTIARNRAQCMENLAIIGRALGEYLADNQERWPFVSKLQSAPSGTPPWPTLPDTIEKYIANPRVAIIPEDKEGARRLSGNPRRVFHCPADHRTLADDSPLRKKFPASTSYFDTEGSSYEWWFGEAYGGKKVGEESLSKSGGFGLGRADSPLLSDFEPFHKGDDQGAINTLNADLKPRTTRARSKE